MNTGIKKIEKTYWWLHQVHLRQQLVERRQRPTVFLTGTAAVCASASLENTLSSWWRQRSHRPSCPTPPSMCSSVESQSQSAGHPLRWLGLWVFPVRKPGEPTKAVGITHKRWHAGLVVPLGHVHSGSLFFLGVLNEVDCIPYIILQQPPEGFPLVLAELQNVISQHLYVVWGIPSSMTDHSQGILSYCGLL